MTVFVSENAWDREVVGVLPYEIAWMAICHFSIPVIESTHLRKRGEGHAVGMDRFFKV